MDKKKHNKIIRYAFMFCIYNLTMATVVYFTQEISEYYSFSFNTWSWITWWAFYAILIFIGGLFAYLTPFFVKCLDTILQRFLTWIQIKYSESIGKLERELDDLKKD